MLEQRCMSWAIAAAVSTLLIACTGSSTGDATTTSSGLVTTTSSQGLDVIARVLDAAPGACPGPAPQYEKVARYFGPLVGGTPIWGGFYAHFNEPANAFHNGSRLRRRKDGWPVKVLWVVEPGTLTPVTLSGHNAVTDAPVRFKIGGVHNPATESAVLDPKHPAIPVQDGRWKEFPSDLYFPSAGCYVLTASWAGGSWQMGFGFGR
jgi:hypothetical protein